MKWLFSIHGGHTHVRVYMNGALCGKLVFRNDEFEGIMLAMGEHIILIDDLVPNHADEPQA